MEFYKCPRYIDCNANLCPLVLDLERLRHLKGEPVCFYVREYVKGTSIPVDEKEQTIYQVVDGQFPVLMKVGGANYREQVKRAAECRSKKHAEILLESAKERDSEVPCCGDNNDDEYPGLH